MRVRVAENKNNATIRIVRSGKPKLDEATVEKLFKKGERLARRAGRADVRISLHMVTGEALAKERAQIQKFIDFEHSEEILDAIHRDKANVAIVNNAWSVLGNYTKSRATWQAVRMAFIGTCFEILYNTTYLLKMIAENDGDTLAAFLETINAPKSSRESRAWESAQNAIYETNRYLFGLLAVERCLKIAGFTDGVIDPGTYDEATMRVNEYNAIRGSMDKLEWPAPFSIDSTEVKKAARLCDPSCIETSFAFMSYLNRVEEKLNMDATFGMID